MARRRKGLSSKTKAALFVFGVGVGVGIVEILAGPRRNPLPPTVPPPKRIIDAEFKVKR